MPHALLQNVCLNVIQVQKLRQFFWVTKRSNRGYTVVDNEYLAIKGGWKVDIVSLGGEENTDLRRICFVEFVRKDWDELGRFLRT